MSWKCFFFIYGYATWKYHVFWTCTMVINTMFFKMCDGNTVFLKTFLKPLTMVIWSCLDIYYTLFLIPRKYHCFKIVMEFPFCFWICTTEIWCSYTYTYTMVIPWFWAYAMVIPRLRTCTIVIKAMWYTKWYTVIAFGSTMWNTTNNISTKILSNR